MYIIMFNSLWPSDAIYILDPGSHWSRYIPGAWRHHAITLTSVDLL